MAVLPTQTSPAPPTPHSADTQGPDDEADDEDSAYSAAKAGVMALTRAVAAEVGPHGIRVNAVAPDLIWNEHLARIYPESYFEDLRSRSVTGKTGTPEDMARIILFLATDTYLTGQVINGSGGFYMHP